MKKIAMQFPLWLITTKNPGRGASFPTLEHAGSYIEYFNVDPDIHFKTSDLAGTYFILDDLGRRVYMKILMSEVLEYHLESEDATPEDAARLAEVRAKPHYDGSKASGLGCATIVGVLALVLFIAAAP